jgi:rhodanese-related sulfurtransferase
MPLCRPKPLDGGRRGTTLNTKKPGEDSVMTFKKIILTCTVFLVLAGMPALGLAYNLMGPEDLKLRIDSGQPPILVDIQPKNAFNEHHFFGSIRTYAYPAKTEKDTDSLVQAVRMYKSTGNEVIIIGPRGGRAEQRAHNFLAGRGIPEGKLYILKGGIGAWPYKEMLQNIRGGCQ